MGFADRNHLDVQEEVNGTWQAVTFSPASVPAVNYSTEAYNLPVLSGATAIDVAETIYTGFPYFGNSTTPYSSPAAIPATKPLSLTAGPSTAVYGQPVTLTASIVATSGSVAFLANHQVIGQVPVVAGTATLETTSLPVGKDSLTAVYIGPTFRESTAPVAETVQQAVTATALAATPDPAVVGQTVMLTATVAVKAPGGGTPTGTVTFYDNGQSLGTGTLNAQGVATLTTAQLPGSTDSLSAVYGGSPSYAGSTSAAVSETVNPAHTTTVLTTSSNPAVVGQTVTLTAPVAVQAPGGGTPTGTVTFYDNGQSLGTGTLTGGVAELTTTTLPVGSDALTAVYGGNPN